MSEDWRQEKIKNLPAYLRDVYHDARIIYHCLSCGFINVTPKCIACQNETRLDALMLGECPHCHADVYITKNDHDLPFCGECGKRLHPQKDH